MITKIWPIKADYANVPGKVGGIEGLKNAIDYINDPEKTIVSDYTTQTATYDDFFDEETNRVFQYMANADKTESKYVSGYMCDPSHAIKDFEAANILLKSRAKFNQRSLFEKETGAIAFHIVQSFPKELNISPEEVHQCGLEFAKKIKAHQSIICSHVHPQMDVKTGIVHGEAMHNHILINAYIHPDYWDPKHPNRLKYNDCKKTYAQLQVWNDEIAIEHGLPIIRNPDDERKYSWFESDSYNKGLSWKQSIRMDIEGAKRVSSNWNEFIEVMTQAGYQIKDMTHTVYIAPDGKHKARGDKLGRAYTKKDLELYWEVKAITEKAIHDANRDDKEVSPLASLMDATNEIISVAIPIGRPGYETSCNYYLPLNTAKNKIKLEALKTYFKHNQNYDICDEKNRPIAAAEGWEIINYITQNQNDKKFTEEHKKKRYYSEFINSQTGEPYSTSIYNQHGRILSMLELLFIMAIIVLTSEKNRWSPKYVPKEEADNMIYAPTNWKIQNMIDSIAIAREQNIQTPEELSQRAHDIGAAYSRAKKAYENTSRAKSKMEDIHAAVQSYLAVKDISEKILALSDSEEKANLVQKHQKEIEQYKKCKAILHRNHVLSKEEINDFNQRYEKISQDVEEIEKRFNDSKENYRIIKKLQYNAALAQNAQYCYGPAYNYQETEKQAKLQPDKVK